MMRSMAGPQSQRPEGRTAEVASSSAGPRGLLSQALQAEPTVQPAENTEQAEDEAQTQDTGRRGNTVVRSSALVPALFRSPLCGFPLCSAFSVNSAEQICFMA